MHFPLEIIETKHSCSVAIGHLSISPSCSETLYGVSLKDVSDSVPVPSSQYEIDPVTGAGTVVGTGLGFAVNSIVVDPTTGFMYGTETNWPDGVEGEKFIESF